MRRLRPALRIGRTPYSHAGIAWTSSSYPPVARRSRANSRREVACGGITRPATVEARRRAASRLRGAMLTTADVSAVPIFQALPDALRERLARTSADLRLSPGEFAVPEGGERALFAVLSGALEVV